MLAPRTDPGASRPLAERSSESQEEVGASSGPRLSGWTGAFAGPRGAVVVLAIFCAFLMVGGVPMSTATAEGLREAGTAAAPPLPTGLLALPESYGALPVGAVDLGPASPSARVSFNLEVNIPSTGPAQAFVTDVSTPGSPEYGQYVSGAQYVSMFGPSPATRAALLSYLTAGGLTVQSVGSLGLLYGVSGSVAQVDATLRTTMDSYRSGTTVALAPASAPALPDDLAPWVESFHNLNGLDLAHPDYQVMPGFTSALITPAEMTGAYDSTTLSAGGDTGAKYVIGLAEMCDPGESTSGYQSDVNTFDTQYGLAADSLTFNGSGETTCSPGYSGWDLETDLDIQWSHVIAPGSDQEVCLDDNDPSVCDTNFIAAGIIFGSNSWTGSGTYTSIWQTAAAAGDTLLAAAGDDCAEATSAPADPAEEPDGIGVGGTSLTVSGTSYGSETVWATSCSSPGAGGEGTGGGCSSTMAPPSYQIGMTGYPGACSSTTERGIPDVAMDADPNTGVTVIENGGSNQVGGTSLATPMWAASLDLIYEASGFKGFFGPEVYALAKSAKYTTYYHDITSGNNGYAATTGWDPATGVGTPDIGQIASGIVSPLVVGLTASRTTLEAGTTVTFGATVSGGSAPYSFTWELNGTAIQGAPDSASFSWTPAYPAVYQVSVLVTDTTGSSATGGPITVTVVPGPLITSFDVSPTFAEGGQVVNMSVFASGGTPAYHYNWLLNNSQFAATGVPTETWTVPDQSGDYLLGVSVVDSLGGSQTDNTIVVVAQRMVVLFQVHPLSPIDSGMNVTLVGTIAGGFPRYFANITENSSKVLLYDEVRTGNVVSVGWRPFKAATYTLDFNVADNNTHSHFTVVTPAVKFLVNGNLSASLSPPATSVYDVGQFISLHALESGGTAPYTYAWSSNNQGVKGDISPTYSFTPAAPASYSIYVTASDQFFRSYTTPAISLTVNPDPTVVIGGPSSLTAGQSGTFTAKVTGGTPGYSYLWAINQTGQAQASGDSLPFSEPHAGTFVIEVEVIDDAGYSVWAYASVNVTAVSVAFIPGTTALESDLILVAALVAVVAVGIVLIFRRRKPKVSTGTGMGPGGTWAPLPGASAGGAAAALPAGFCGGCGAPKVAGAASCAKCGRPYGPTAGAPIAPGAPAPAALPPPGSPPGPQ